MNEYISKAEFNGLKQHMKDVVEPIKDSVGRIDNHLKKLNAQVSKNTAFRNKVTGALIFIGFVGLGNIATLVVLIIKLVK